MVRFLLSRFLTFSSIEALLSLSILFLCKFWFFQVSMASEADQVPELSSLFERVLRHRDLSLFLPFVLGFTGNSTTTTTTNITNPENPDQETGQTTGSTQERVILINPFTQGMVVIEGSLGLDSLVRELANKSGQPPASKESIESMPTTEIGEGEDKEGECVICLEEWDVGVMTKEMPCRHKFHPNCIEKWLGIHGSCPVCRYKMPVDDELNKKRDEEDGGREGRRIGREIWVSFSFNGNRRDSDTNNQTPPSSDDSSDISPLSTEQETED